MPPTRDPAVIRAILQTDPRWAVYALGDLAPGLFEHSFWLRSADTCPALLLLYRGFDPPVLFALGDAAGVQGLLGELSHDGDLFLHVRPEILPALRRRYDIPRAVAMWRMTLNPPDYRPAPTNGAIRLGPAEVAALERLYADGAETGESPHFFLPSMVREGVFFGLYEGAELIAAAGTHLVVPQESVAAIGCVYTRRNSRGKGLATCVTSAVVNELLRLRLATIALNVSQENTRAARIYERLGFVRYCAYYEGLALRRQPTGDPAT
jgi:ribosomal protein S18 acetylase RimI-like enzyme